MSLTGAEALSSEILKQLEGFQPEAKLIAQCYDGAAVMSGCHSGVQARVRDEIPQALYIHCMGHEVFKSIILTFDAFFWSILNILINNSNL